MKNQRSTALYTQSIQKAVTLLTSFVLGLVFAVSFFATDETEHLNQSNDSISVSADNLTGVER